MHVGGYVDPYLLLPVIYTDTLLVMTILVASSLALQPPSKNYTADRHLCAMQDVDRVSTLDTSDPESS